MSNDTEIFETHRPALQALAYRMLGDCARAEDAVQEAWVRWQGRAVEAASPKASLLTTVTRLCLDELGSARARQEQSRSDRLPEPVALEESAHDRLQAVDQISMAFLVLLQRLAPAERAVLLLHDVFDLGHGEIAKLLDKSDAACRQLLSRARAHVTTEKRVFQTSREEHRRLLLAFLHAATRGEQEPLMELLAKDAVMIADPGPHGARVGRIRSLGKPVTGRKKIAAVVKAFAGQNLASPPTYEERELNGEPAVVALRDGRPFAAILVSVAEGRIRHVFMQLDPERLQHLERSDS